MITVDDFKEAQLNWATLTELYSITGGEIDSVVGCDFSGILHYMIPFSKYGGYDLGTYMHGFSMGVYLASQQMLKPSSN